MKKTITMIMIYLSLCIVSASTLPFYEDFEGSVFPPLGWETINADGDNYNWEHINWFPANYGERMAGSQSWITQSSPNQYLILPPLTIDLENVVLEYYVVNGGALYPYETYSVLVSTTTPTIDAFTSIHQETLAPINENWQKRSISLADYQGETIYIAFRHFDSLYQGTLGIDDVHVYVGSENDLVALSVSGESLLYANEESIYVVSVLNEGSAEATGYSIRLVVNGMTIDYTNPVPSIPVQSTHEFQIGWTPASTGTYEIFGEIVWDLDQDPSNNRTPSIFVTAIPSGAETVYVGIPGHEAYSNTFPLSFINANNLSQTIYLEEEIGINGYLTHIIYNFQGYGNVPDNIEYKFYMAITDKMIFENTNSWVDFDSFTLVYSGGLPLASQGRYDVIIELDEPFLFIGGNLVIMAQRIWNSSAWTSSNFNGWQVSWYPEAWINGENRSINAVSSQAISIPPSSNVTYSVSDVYPNISLIFNFSDTGVLAGTVTTNGTPLQGVKIKIDNTAFETFSNSMGQYHIENVLPGIVSITASLDGYLDIHRSDVNIVVGQLTTENFEMILNPLISVSGKVISSRTNQPIENAKISLTGHYNYLDFFTGVNGEFFIPDVFALQQYTLTIDFAGHITYIDSINIGSESLNLETIMLFEKAYMPTNVQAIESDNNVIIAWDAASSKVDKWFSQNEDLDAYHKNPVGIGTGGPATIITAHRYTQSQLESLSIAGAFLTRVGFIPHELPQKAEIRIYSGGMDVPYDPGTMLHSQEVNSIIAGEWNEIELNTPIPIPTNSEFWIAIYYEITSGFVAGVDSGPLNAGFGNVIFDGEWTTLWTLTYIAGNPLPYNWMIKGYAVGAEGPYLSRDAENYNLYRGTVENIDNSSSWTPIASNISDLLYIDSSWSDLPQGAYQYIVEAVYNNDNVSGASFSNIIGKDMNSIVTIHINKLENKSTETLATISLINNTGNQNHQYHQITSDSFAFFPSVWMGNYTLRITVPGYAAYINNNLDIMENPFNYEANLDGLLLIQEGFEGTIFPPPGWTLINMSDNGHNWLLEPNNMAFAHTGFGTAMSFSWDNIPFEPDAYLISESIELPQDTQKIILQYYIGIHDEYHPSETYSVLISNSDSSVESFVPLFNETLQAENKEWALREVDITNYAGMKVYLAWRHHDSYDQYVLKLDDIELYYLISTNEADIPVNPISTALKMNYPNPFNPTTLISFDNAASGNVKIDIFNIRGQKVKTLVDEHFIPGSHSVEWDGKDSVGRPVSSGVYFYQMKTDDYTAIRRMVLMK